MRRYSRRTRIAPRRPRGRRAVARPARRVRRSAPLRKRKSLRVARVEAKRGIHGAAIQPWPIGHLNFVTNIVPLTPYDAYLTINKGTGRCERIGNMVSVKKHVLRFVFTVNERDASNTDEKKVARPMYVRLWFFKLKPRLPQTVTEAAQIAQQKMFQWGTAADLGLFGTVNDLIQPINEEAMQLVTTRTFKLGRSSMAQAGYPAGAGLIEIQNNASWANNDFLLTARGKVDITKYVPKDFKFEDGESSTIIDRPLFMMCTLHPADGSAYTSAYYTGDPNPVNMWYRNDLEYIDP